MNKMVIGLDFDGTITEDPQTWLHVIKVFINAGHEIVIVTMRFESEVCQLLADFGKYCRIICTGRLAKDDFCKKLGINVNVWIDDHPAAVIMDADQIWNDVLPEGRIMTTNSKNHNPIIAG